MEHKFSLTSGHEPEPYARTTSTNGDHDALAETPTAKTATTALEQMRMITTQMMNMNIYVKTETDKNIESKKRCDK